MRDERHVDDWSASECSVDGRRINLTFYERGQVTHPLGGMLAPYDLVCKDGAEMTEWPSLRGVDDHRLVFWVGRVQPRVYA